MPPSSPQRAPARPSSLSATPARLALAGGAVFHGRAFGAVRPAAETAGELVFNTAMSGYEEVATDPSYRGQLVVMTAPQIGNVGWNQEDLESGGAHLAGFVIRELSQVASNWRSQVSLHDALAQAGVPAIEGVDTRALTRALRDGGAQTGLLSFAPPGERSDEELVQAARAFGGMEGRDLASEVSCARPYRFEEGSVRMPGEAPPAHAVGADVTGHVVVYDFGVKRNILRQLVDVGFRVTVVPARTPAAEALALQPDAFLLSNGPGDPAALPYAAETTRGLLASGKPLLGICLGHQILGLALGGRTYKLKFGHHGVNHPVKDLQTGRVEITSQNHGFAVDVESLSGRATLTHLNLNDRTVEGMALSGRPVFSIQYHPEAAPGPKDADYLFGRFAALVRDGKPGPA